MYQQLIEYAKEPLSNSFSSFSLLDQKAFLGLTSSDVYLPTLQFDFIPNQDPLQKWNLWKLLLKNILVSKVCGSFERHQNKLRSFWEEMVFDGLIEGFQAELLYSKLTAHILNIPFETEVEIIQKEDGICPIYLHDHFKLLKMPRIEQQAEMGILMVILGKSIHQPKLIHQAHKIALWHTQNMDFEYVPFRGFLTNHSRSDFTNLILSQALLFQAVSSAIEDQEIAFYAKKHFSYLLQSQQHLLKELSFDLLLLYNLIENFFEVSLTPVEKPLTEEIKSKNLPLVGLRKSEVSSIFSLVGNNTSMGSFRYHDLEIAALGPQINSLGDGNTFGAIGGQNLVQDYESNITPDSYFLKGCIGLPNLNSNLNFLQSWQHSLSWLQIDISYQKEVLSIGLQPLKVPKDTYFVFYLISNQCLIKGEKKTLYHSLEQFHGNACSVSFLSKNNILNIDPSFDQSDMKIIPLQGQQSFWGANYLIAYHLNPKYSTFGWKITGSFR